MRKVSLLLEEDLPPAEHVVDDFFDVDGLHLITRSLFLTPLSSEEDWR